MYFQKKKLLERVFEKYATVVLIFWDTNFLNSKILQEKWHWGANILAVKWLCDARIKSGARRVGANLKKVESALHCI